LELTAERDRRRRNKIARWFPDEGPFRRELYPRHLRFIELGAHHRERLLLAANRVGKTELGAYELTCHLTGIYPPWWNGRIFTRPTRAWVAGDTSKTVREILQEKLLGQYGDFGTGMIPGALIASTVPKPGVPEAVETVYVKHASGGYSKLVLKTYDQKREAFQGSEQDIIWLDEEPPEAIYTECLLRTMTTDGLVLLTFTPLNGLTDVILQFLPGGRLGGDEETEAGAKAIVMASWDDVPHLDENAKKELWASIPPYQRDARSKGVPQLGSGAIYPVPETDIVCAPFEIPKHWPRAYGLDVGWNRTAAVWGARDPDTGVTFLFSEYYRGQAEPSINAEAVRSRGAWIPGVIDPASRGRSQTDGQQLFQMYQDLGLNLQLADNGVSAGLLQVWQMLSTGKLKIFSTLTNLLEEYRLYRRDEKGNVVKQKDHLMDAKRYLVVSGLALACTEPTVTHTAPYQPRGWMS